MNDLFRYFSPAGVWVVVWWLLLKGTLLAFLDGFAGALIRGHLQELAHQYQEWVDLFWGLQ